MPFELSEYRLLFEQNPNPMWVYDPATRGFLAVNRTALDHYGYTRDEFVAMTAEQLLAEPADAGRRPEDDDGFFRHRRRDGQVIEVEVQTSPLKLEGQRVRLAMITDVTAQRRMERALSEAEQMWRSLADHTPDIFVLLDAEDRISYTNFGPRARREKAIGRPYLSFLPPELAERRREDFARIRAQLLPESYETKGFGEYADRWFEQRVIPLPHADGKVHLIVINADITRKKQDQAALAAREARFRALVEKGTDALCLAGGDARITYASAAYERILGREVEAVTGQPLFAFVHPDDRDAFDRVWTECLAKPGVPVREELRYIDAGGGERYLEAMRVNRLDDPAVHAVVTVYRDVSERRHMEEQLREAQKMEAVGRLAGGIAHDFNNMLSAITGFASVILGELDDRESIIRDAREILSAASRATGLTRQLLAFGRRQVLQPCVLDLNELLGTMEHMLQRLLGQDIELVVRLDGRFWVKADPGQLEQVLINLAVNARDAMPKGGRVEIATRTAQITEAEARALSEVTPGAYAVLRVRDDGTGMERAVLDRIFEPFFTTKPKGRGTGLGLSTALGIVKQSGGHIAVTSSPGKGSNFEVFLPASAPPEDTVPEPPSTLVATDPATVLLVDDDAPVRQLIARMLIDIGHRVLEAESGQQALDLAQAHPGEIAVLLTDVVMPGMSGPKLATALRRVRPEVRVLYMSGGPTGIRDESFILKPLDPGTLAKKLRQVLAG